MLGIFLIYWVGKKYYDLAEYHNRSPWGFAILAIAVYYGSQFIFGLFIALAFPEFFEKLDSGTEFMINLLGIGVGLGVWYLGLKYIERKWEVEVEVVEDQIDTIGKDLES